MINDKRLQSRDIDALNLVNLCGICTRKQIQDIIFKDISETVCIRRLKFLNDIKALSRSRYNISDNSNQYVYYTGKKPSKKLLKHELAITDFILSIYKEGIEISNVSRACVIGDVIPDAIIEVVVDNKIKRFLLEVQLSGKLESCVTKYKSFEDKIIKHTQWRIAPTLIVVSDIQGDKIRVRGMNVKYSSTNINNIRDILFK